MAKEMFEDVGKEIKVIAAATAKWITACHILLGVGVFVGGIAVSVTMGNGWAWFVGLLLGAGIGLFGYFKARRETIVLYAYGELVDKTNSIERTVSRKNGGKIESAPKPVKVKPNKSSDKDAHAETPKVQRQKDGTWVCVYCDHRNSADAKWCEECGFEAEFS